MKVLRTLVGSGGGIFMCDTLEYEGGIWLVPHWLLDPVRRVRMPVRIVRMDLLPHQKSTFGGSDFLLNGPMPRAVLDGVTQFAEGMQYEVVESPPIQIPLPPAGH